MKILVFGAGVIGSIYAAKLYQASSDVTLLARGKRYDDLKQNGIIIKDTLSGKQIISKVPLTKELKTDDFYDLIIVTVRLDEVDTVVPVLKKNSACSLVMFMLNNPENIEQLTNELNHKHIILGFPGVGGTHHANFIDYIQIKQQKTTIGEINGEKSILIKEIKALFERAGFEVAINDNMPAWLKIHAVFIVCIAAAIIKENGSSVQLGKKRSSVKKMVKSIREGFIACKTLGIPIVPANLKIIFLIMPQWFSVLYWQRAMQGKIGSLAMAPHANAAKDEMQLIAKKILVLIHSSSFLTPTLDKLLSPFIR